MRDFYDDIWNSAGIQDEVVRHTVESRLAHVGQIPPQLFDRAHPRRDPPRGTRRFAAQKAVILLWPGILHCEIAVDQGRARLYTIDSQARCSLATVDIADAVRNGMLARRWSVLEHVPGMQNLGWNRGQQSQDVTPVGSLRHAYSREGFDYVWNETDVMAAKPASDQVEVRFRHRTAIVCISVDGDWTAVGDRDASFSMYDHGQHKFSIPIFTSSVRSLALSVAFRLVVCGTRDGSLVLCALNSGIVTRTVTVAGRRPVRILITPAWGFILVYFREISNGVLRHMLTLYTVNGDFVREIEIDAAILVWSAWRDDNGFDWVALALGSGCCHVFEAFWLRLGAPLLETRNLVVGIAFSWQLQTVIAVFSDGQALFIPWEEDVGDRGGDDSTEDSTSSDQHSGT
jgi:hypothetical protein